MSAFEVTEKGPVETSHSFTSEQREALAIRLGKSEKSLTSELEIGSQDVEFLLDVMQNLNEQEAREILETGYEVHRKDPNFPASALTTIEELLDPNFEMDEESRQFAMKMEAAVLHYHAPYPDVRAIADPFDDPTIPVETFRAYLLGTIWTIVGVGVNQFFEPRQPPISISGPVLQLLCYPCGKFCEYVLPDWGFTFRGKRHTLNPGPWNQKEQLLVTIMFNITAALIYINSQIFVQRMPMFYDNHWAGFGYQFTLALSTQYLGFGIAGLARHILVFPINALWPANFPILAMNRALLAPEKRESINGWTISRYKFFFYVFIGTFFYFWLPNYLFSALSYFNWMTWIAPNNFNLAAITGSIAGMGINPIPTFDWSIINYVNPLYTPFFAQLNNYMGALFGGAILIPAIYFSGMYWTNYLSMNSSSIFTNKGELYDVKQVLNDQGVLDQKKFEAYGTPFYTAGNLAVYGTFFAMYPMMFVDSCLRQWKIIYTGFRQLFEAVFRGIPIQNTHNDAHSRMMRAYPEVPIWWYLIILVISLVLGIVCVEIYPTEAPVWGIFLALALGIIFLIPIGLLYATTANLFSLNVLTELIAGYALPGRGIALMIIKSFGLNVNLQAIYFIQDQKLGHYGKIPPRATFKAQLVATFICVLVVMGVANWQINNFDDLCQKTDGNKFQCPNEYIYYSASVFWGVIGPKRVFDQIYPVLKYTFLIGALIPVPFYLYERFVSDKLSRWFNPILFCYGIINFYAPYNLSYATGGMYVSFAFMWYLRNRYTSWFEKYTYVLSAGLSAGVAISAIIIFFAVQYKEVDLSWWGNNVSFVGADGADGPLDPLPAKGYFGPAPGTFHY